MPRDDVGGAAGVEFAQQGAFRGVEVAAGFLDRFHAGQQVVVGVEVLVEAGDLRRHLGQHRYVEHVFEYTGGV